MDLDWATFRHEVRRLVLSPYWLNLIILNRTESVNFIHDVNVLRQNLKSVYANSADLQALNSEVDKLPKNCTFTFVDYCVRNGILTFSRSDPSLACVLATSTRLSQERCEAKPKGARSRRQFWRG